MFFAWILKKICYSCTIYTQIVLFRMIINYIKSKKSLASIKKFVYLYQQNKTIINLI